MIKINNKIIEISHFPDNTQMLLNVNLDVSENKPINIVWCYEQDAEAMSILFLKRHIESHYNNEVYLQLAFVPNARMDRVKSDCEVFTLKYFCEFINYLNFRKVFIVDPHSIVSEALIDNVCVLGPSNSISKAINKMRGPNGFEREVVIYFPDDGAYKRYKDLPCFKILFKNLKFVYGKKERDWNTGEILGIEIYDKNGCKLTNELENCDVLMVDDIISYGGTLAYSADKLKAMGAAHISAFATHVENSVLDEEKGTLLKRYKDKIIDTVYTTNSIYHGNHPMVEVIHKF